MRWSWESQSPAQKTKVKPSHRINNALQDKGGDWTTVLQCG